MFPNSLTPTPFLQKLTLSLPKRYQNKLSEDDHKVLTTQTGGISLGKNFLTTSAKKRISHSELVSPIFCPKGSEYRRELF